MKLKGLNHLFRSVSSYVLQFEDGTYSSTLLHVHRSSLGLRDHKYRQRLTSS